MKLFISSARLDSPPAPLARLAARGRIGIVMNALDDLPDLRAIRLPQQVTLFSDIAASVEELDLRDGFDAPAALRRKLERLDLVWINGGDPVLLRHAMARSGFDVAIRSMLADDRIACAGFSAAAAVLGRDVRGPAGGDARAGAQDGMPILPWAIIVHSGSNGAKGIDAEAELDLCKLNAVPFLTLRDGEALYVDGDLRDLALLDLGSIT